MTKAPRIGIYFTRPGEEGYPLDRLEYATAYRELALRLESNGAEIFIARTRGSYLGNNRFSDGWKYRAGELQRIAESFDVDVIFNKGEEGDLMADASSNFVNGSVMECVCRKDVTCTLFPEFLPYTIVVHEASDLPAALAEMPGETVVCKPPMGEGGVGIQMLLKSEAQKKIRAFPVVVQEFIDTSGGIPGITPGLHDLRIIIIRGKIVVSFIRTPPAGSLLANVSQGGKRQMVDVADVPKEPMRIAKAVDSTLTHIPDRLYSVDMGRSANGNWQIFELNAPPGMIAIAINGGESERYHEALANLLIERALDERR